ncbi:MAG: hypothetical protein CL868_00730 [Cytophagaceae bacterium]|nr:hypothetical protein [Salipiger sp.]MAZ25585.1 hypothetical protein [Cytophagaceae bacterium]
MTKKSSLKGHALWSAVLQFSRFGGNAVIFLAMARFLSLEEIGAFGLAYAPIRWTQVLQKTGISNSVIVSLRSRHDTEQINRDPVFTTLFYLAMAISLLVVGLLVVSGLVMERTSTSDQPVGTMMLVMAIVPFAFGLASVPEGLLRKNLEIRSLALRTLAVQAAAAGLAVVMAIEGFGAWSLVGFAVLNAVASSIISIVMAGWRPSGSPSLSSMKAQLPQFSAISGRALVSGAAMPMLQFLVGIVIGLEAAGAFQIAQRVYQILDALCLAPLRFLVLPLFSRAAEASEGKLSGDTVLRTMRIAGLVSAPFYLGTLAIADPALTLVIGPENASHAVPLLQIFCLLGINITSITVLSQAFTVAGHAGMVFWRSIWMLCITIVLSGPALMLSVEAVILGFVISSYVALAVFYRQIEQVFAISGAVTFGAVARPYLAATLAMAPVFALQWYLQPIMPLWGILVVQILLGALLYLAAAKFIAPKAFGELRRVLRR